MDDLLDNLDGDDDLVESRPMMLDDGITAFNKDQ